MLWVRFSQTPGQGRPDYRKMHPLRQRHVMLHRLCQVCGGPADRSSRGWLYLASRKEDSAHVRDSPEGALTTKPPVCLACAALALRHCPHLTDPVAIRSRKPRVWGVFGGFYAPGPSGGLVASPSDDYLLYGHPAAPWFVAFQLVTELTRCTEVDLTTDIAPSARVSG